MKNIGFPALLAGLFLYLTADFCFCLTCWNVTDSVFSASMNAAFVLGGIITILLLVRYRTSLKSQLLIGIITQLTFWGFFVMDSVIGITRRFVAFSEDNYAAGLVMVIFWLQFTGISVIGFVFTAVVQCIRKCVRIK